MASSSSNQSIPRSSSSGMMGPLFSSSLLLYNACLEGSRYLTSSRISPSSSSDSSSISPSSSSEFGAVSGEMVLGSSPLASAGWVASLFSVAVGSVVAFGAGFSELALSSSDSLSSSNSSILNWLAAVVSSCLVSAGWVASVLSMDLVGSVGSAGSLGFVVAAVGRLGIYVSKT